jgi:hypothetical protein
VKVQLVGLLITGSLLVSARADLTVVEKIEGSLATEVTWKIKGHKIRLDTPGGNPTVIDKQTGEILIWSSNKVFKRIAGPKPEELEESKVTSTGRKETILGHETEEFVVETPSEKSIYWIALKYPAAAEIIPQVQLILGESAPNFRDLPGVPIRIHRKDSDGKEVTLTITSIKRDPVDEAEFLPPKDYVEEGRTS